MGTFHRAKLVFIKVVKMIVRKTILLSQSSCMTTWTHFIIVGNLLKEDFKTLINRQKDKSAILKDDLPISPSEENTPILDIEKEEGKQAEEKKVETTSSTELIEKPTGKKVKETWKC